MNNIIVNNQLNPCYIPNGINTFPVKPFKRKLEARQHQLEAIKAITKGLQGVARGKGIMPCAFGKTLTALWVMEALHSKCTIVIVPSLALLRQFKASWDENQMNHVPTLCVCSEKDIDGRDNRSGVTTNIQEIISFLSKHKRCIVYATYQSLEVISKASKEINYSFDFAICDEAHKTVGNSKNGLFTTIHSDEKISIKKRLYMTATPRIISDVVKGRIKYLVDMYDEPTYGPELYRMSFREAINRGILTDYKIVTIGIKNSHVNSKSDAINNHALDFAMRKHDINHVLAFFSSIKKAKCFQEVHQKLYPDVFVGHINGTMSTEERLAVLAQFKKAENGIITNVKALTEGVDCPMIDGVFFCDPKNSVTDIVQGAGRALRLALGKTFGYIIVPIFHNNDGNVEGDDSKSVFSNLVSVIRAMGDVDENLIDEIRSINAHNGISENEENCHIELLGLDWSDIDWAEIERVKKNLFTQIVSRASVPSIKINHIKKTLVDFETVREFARSLGLPSWYEWISYIRGELEELPPRPEWVPKYPFNVYKGKGWIDRYDFLGIKHPLKTKKHP